MLVYLKKRNISCHTNVGTLFWKVSRKQMLAYHCPGVVVGIRAIIFYISLFAATLVHKFAHSARLAMLIQLNLFPFLTEINPERKGL